MEMPKNKLQIPPTETEIDKMDQSSDLDGVIVSPAY